jgi:hypothetical protein
LAEQSKQDRRIIEHFEVLRAEMDNERSSFMHHWRDIGDHIMPRRPRFFTSDNNKGDKRHDKIKDITATMAARTLQSGMMSGITSPAREWFRLSIPDNDNFTESGPVKQWLDEVTKRMRTVFLKSNLYNVLPTIYGDIGAFGTAALFVEEDFEKVIRCQALPIGSYYISNNHYLKVDKIIREFRMTVRQVVEKFATDPTTGEIDWSNVSEWVKQQYYLGDQQGGMHGHKETWVEVAHMIIPNPDWDPRKLEAKYKKYLSVYFERGSSGGPGSGRGIGTYFHSGERYKVLRESGYDHFPALCPRWETTGTDVYGTNSPGMIALGDIKQLQLGEKRSLQALDKIINPAMIGPTHMKNTRASMIPGDITYADEQEGQKGFRPVHEVRFDINALEQKQQQVRQRISKAFFEDLFLMLANSDRRQITAREIDERHEEKLLALGPVLEQLNQDLLDPLIDVVYDMMDRQGLLPPPPEELGGIDLKVEYISIMAQAQKLIGVGGIERFTRFAGELSAVNPAVLDLVDFDKVVVAYHDITGVPPETLRPKEEVEAIREQKAKAAQQAAAQQQLMGGAQVAKDLSSASMEDENVLSQVLGEGGLAGG